MNAFVALDERIVATAQAVRPRWTVSIVSHGHGPSVVRAILSLSALLAGTPHRFVVTQNIPESLDLLGQLPPAVRQCVQLRRNTVVKGFAANHNAALGDASSDYLLIADPDLLVPGQIFPELERALGDVRCGVVAPQAWHPDGFPEDNGRALVTPAGLARRYLLRNRRPAHRGRADDDPAPALEVDWVAGLFMAMRSETFHRLGGFDEGFHLYCEDVDLCLRARLDGLQVCLLPQLRITHAARRRTLKRGDHFRWHVGSLLRLWRSEAYRRARRQRRRSAAA